MKLRAHVKTHIILNIARPQKVLDAEGKAQYMGENFLSVKYGLFVSLFVSFHHDLESKLAIREAKKEYPVDKYTKDSDGIALFVLQVGSI